jgi:hypothetical protein
MRILILGTILAALLLVGCSTPHTLVMKDGSEIQTSGEPIYNDRTGFYEFEDRDGLKHQVNKDEVRALREGD